MRHLAAGRAIYATGSNQWAARLTGLDTGRVKFSVFVAIGVLTGVAALLNSVRFNQIPSNAGLGLEMKVIASVIVGGTTITGGRGTVVGTLLGVILLGAIGPALTFLGASAYWERALQGAIILAAVAADTVRILTHRRWTTPRPSFATIGRGRFRNKQGRVDCIQSAAAAPWWASAQPQPLPECPQWEATRKTFARCEVFSVCRVARRNFTSARSQNRA